MKVEPWNISRKRIVQITSNLTEMRESDERRTTIRDRSRYLNGSISNHDMSSPLPAENIFEENPYENHPSLSPIEAQLLWEYSKLAQNVKQVSSHFPSFLWAYISRILVKVATKTRRLTEEPDQMLVSRLRSLETKMGLVLVLVRLSI